MDKKVFTSDMVDDYANKLLIGLTENENKMVLDEFSQIDEDFKAFEKIEGLNKGEPMSWCLDRTVDHLRDDVVEESLSLDDALRNSGRANDRELEVPRMVE